MTRTISHYRLEGELGRGGMGIVFRATDIRLGRPVAIKMLAAEATADGDRVRRFIQEARSFSRAHTRSSRDPASFSTTPDSTSSSAAAVR